MAQPLVYGELVDFLSGRTVPDTEDERYRQKIARFLVEKKGYLKTDIQVQRELPLRVDENSCVVRVDFSIVLEEKVVLIVRFAPGSVVSRERPTLAAARLLEPYATPFAVATNGTEAHILDTTSGEVIGQGFDAIPSKAELTDRLSELEFHSLSEKRLEKESRILFMFEAVATCSLP